MQTTIGAGRIKWQKYGYAIFVLAGIVFILKKDFSMAVIFWALAAVFDPFDAKVTYGNRPLWQRIWLVVHVVFVFSLLILEILLRK